MLLPFHRHPRTLRRLPELTSDEPETALPKRRRSFLDEMYRRIDDDLKDR